MSNNPLNAIDPSGLFPGGGILGGIGDFFTGGGCGDGGLFGDITNLAGGIGDGLGAIGGFVWDNRVTFLKTLAIGVLITAFWYSPVLGVYALAPNMGYMVPLLQGVSLGVSLLAESQDTRPGQGDRITRTLGVGAIGFGLGGFFQAVPLMPEALGWMLAGVYELGAVAAH